MRPNSSRGDFRHKLAQPLGRLWTRVSRAGAVALALVLWAGASPGCTTDGNPHPDPPDAVGGSGAKAGSGASGAGGSRAGQGGSTPVSGAGSGGSHGNAGAGGGGSLDGGPPDGAVPTCDEDAGIDDCDGGALAE